MTTTPNHPAPLISAEAWNVIQDALYGLSAAIDRGNREPWLDYADFDLGNPDTYRAVLATAMAAVDAQAATPTTGDDEADEMRVF